MLGKRRRTYATYTKASKKPKYTATKNPKARMSLLKRTNTITPNKTTRVVMKYADLAIQLNPGAAGAAASYVYCVNGLYDPNVTGIGHQPAGFDEYMAIFQEYVVLGAHVKVSFTNSDTTYPAIVGMSYSDSNVTTTDFRRYVENGYTTWCQLGKSGSGNDIKNLMTDVNVAKTSNQNVVQEENFAGNNTKNPDEARYVIIWAAPLDSTADMGAVYFNVEITFDVLLRDNFLMNLS